MGRVGLGVSKALLQWTQWRQQFLATPTDKSELEFVFAPFPALVVHFRTRRHATAGRCWTAAAKVLGVVTIPITLPENAMPKATRSAAYPVHSFDYLSQSGTKQPSYQDEGSRPEATS